MLQSYIDSQNPNAITPLSAVPELEVRLAFSLALVALGTHVRRSR